MAYQDDFRNKVIAALKKKNLAVDLSEEQTQEAIIQETQIVAQSESKPISPEEMRAIIQDVARQVAAENKGFSAQSSDFTAFAPGLEGVLDANDGSYSGGGIAVSVANKDIVIIPANGGLGAAGSATSVNSISQIDFKYIANPNAYATFDPKEVKASLFNWGERVVGNTYDTPVLGIGGAWNGVSYAPTPQWGVGNSFGSGVGGSINQISGFGQIIFFKPASSTIYAALFNDVAISSDYANNYVSIIGYNSAVPGNFPTAGFAVSFGGIGGSGALAISGAASASQFNRVRFLSPLSVSNSTATDTLTLALSNSNGGSAGTQYFVGNGTTGHYVLSTTSNTFAQGDLFYASGAGHTHLVRLPIGLNNQFLTTNGTIPSWTSSIAANTVSVNAASGTTVLYPLLNNVPGSGSAVSTDIDFNVDPGNNILRYSSGSFYVGTAVSTPLHTSAFGSIYTAGLAVTVRPGTNSATAIQFANAANTTIVVNVDTSNTRLGVNTTSPSYTLDVNGDINASTGFSYRINGTLVLNAGGLGTGVTNSSLTSLGTITTGTWAATAITTLYGGIGNLTTFTIGDLLYANSTTTIAKLAAGTAGSVLTSTGTGSTPNYTSPALLSVGTAVTANNVNLAAVGTTSQTHYIAISRSTTGTGVGLSADSNLTWVSATGTLNAAIHTGTAVTVTSLTGTIITASQPNITTVGTIGTGVWQGTVVGTRYGGTGSNLSDNGGIGNSNRIIITGSTAPYNASLIDNATSGNLLVSGGALAAPTFTNATNATFSFNGTLNIQTAALTNGTITTQPTNANDIANKSYVDSVSAGLDVHGSARLTTLSAIGGSYRQAGTAGTRDGFGDYILATIPATLIGSDAGWDTAGVALTNGQRVLVKDGVTGGYASGNGAWGAFPTTYGGFAASWVANGIYEVRSYGGAATSGWMLVRATDTDNNGGSQELTGGTFLFVEEGTTYADHAFVCSNDTTTLGAIGFGSTQIAWTLFAGGNTLIAGQGLVESGNNLALLVNLVQANAIGGSANLSRGFTLGGTRAASLGSSTLNTFTVTADTDARISTNTFTALADGYSLAGGVTSRTLSVTGSSITLTGGGNTLTLGSNSTANFNSQTLALTASMGNLTFNAGNATPAASTQNIVQSGVAQYLLSINTGFASGDIYYSAGTAYTSLAKLALASGAGSSVLIRSDTAPVWGTIQLGSANFVSGQLGLSNGGTNANLTASHGGIVYSTATTLAIAAAGTAGNVLLSSGAGAPSFSAITLSNTNSVTGTLGISNGGTNSNATPTSGAVAYGNSTAYAFTNAGNGGSVLISNGTNPLFSAINLASTNAVTGILPISNGGTGSTAAQLTSNGVVIYDSTNTRLASASGVTASSTGVYGAGFFIAGNSVVTNVGGIYGAVTISSSASVGGTSFLSASSQNLVINYPGTGITGGGAANRVAYYNAAQEITSNSNFTFSPTASTGVGLSISVGTGVSTVLYVNNTNGSATAGYLVDVDQNGAQRFAIDFKGMTEITAGTGNTVLRVQNGRTVFATSTANYASLNIPSGANMSAVGSTQIGDLWFNGTNLYFRKDANTNQDLLVGSVSGSGTANRVAKWSSTSALTDSNISDAGFGMTITSGGSIATAGSGATALITLQTLLTDDSKTDRYFIRGMINNSGNPLRVFSIDTSGNLRATTKSFDIPHPTKEGMRLVYGVLEGPEHGVYHRGTVEGKGVIQVNLPEYWHKLVGDQYTIQLTPWGNYNVGIGSKTENYFTIQIIGDPISRKFKNIKVDYIVHGSRLDAPLQTEQ